MREQRSHCGRHARSPLHSPFALPAVLPTPPTAAAIHQANLKSRSIQINPRQTCSPPPLEVLRLHRAKVSFPAGCSFAHPPPCLAAPLEAAPPTARHYQPQHSSFTPAPGLTRERVLKHSFSAFHFASWLRPHRCLLIVPQLLSLFCRPALSPRRPAL